MTRHSPRGFCPACGGPFALRKDGTLRRHDRYEARGKYGAFIGYVRCEGSGRKPDAVVAR